MRETNQYGGRMIAFVLIISTITVVFEAHTLVQRALALFLLLFAAIMGYALVFPKSRFGKKVLELF